MSCESVKAKMCCSCERGVSLSTPILSGPIRELATFCLVWGVNPRFAGRYNRGQCTSTTEAACLQCSPSDTKLLQKRISRKWVFVHFDRLCTLGISGKARHFQGITCEVLHFCSNIYFRVFFLVSKKSVSESTLTPPIRRSQGRVAMGRGESRSLPE